MPIFSGTLEFASLRGINDIFLPLLINNWTFRFEDETITLSTSDTCS